MSCEGRNEQVKVGCFLRGFGLGMVIAKRRSTRIRGTGNKVTYMKQIGWSPTRDYRMSQDTGD